MAAHNETLVKKLNNVIAHLQNAAEDAAEDFYAGIAHAQIAQGLLREIIDAGKAADRDRYHADRFFAAEDLYR